EIIEIPNDGLKLNKGEFILAETEEKIGSDFYVPLIHAKSGTARAGLFVHITADLIDIGSYGKSTLQLFATIPIIIYPGMKIAQVTFWQPQGEIELYQGKYQNSDGPMPSLIFLDNEDKLNE
ncbi:MAG: dCTP deaminase, partial [Bdellovibrionaceae bacterium]|nr:dCTP deaminase [Pseudobdellovibrionaceae bacterium]